MPIMMERVSDCDKRKFEAKKHTRFEYLKQMPMLVHKAFENVTFNLPMWRYLFLFFI
jgi:hypothetical protein